jgi:hypothetical protein
MATFIPKSEGQALIVTPVKLVVYLSSINNALKEKFD